MSPLKAKQFFLTGLVVMLLGTGWSHAGVVDQLGRHVAVPSNPQRVVALAPSITEIVFALGREDLLVGATRFSDYPSQAASLPKVGSYIHLDLERIVSLSPDLCIAVKDGNPKAVVDRLEALGIPVYAVNPANLQTVGDTIAEIGRILNAEAEANTLVETMRRRLAAVSAKVAKASHRPRVFFQIGVSPIVSVGSNTIIDELIATAGGLNTTTGPVPYPRLSREEVIALAPDIIIITSMAREEQFGRVKAQWEQWQDIPAVRNRRIFVVDSDIFDRASPRLVEALELLTNLIHPHLAGNTL